MTTGRDLPAGGPEQQPEEKPAGPKPCDRCGRQGEQSGVRQVLVSTGRHVCTLWVCRSGMDPVRSAAGISGRRAVPREARELLELAVSLTNRHRT